MKPGHPAQAYFPAAPRINDIVNMINAPDLLLTPSETFPKVQSCPSPRARAHVDENVGEEAPAVENAAHLKQTGKSLVVSILESDPEITPLIVAAIKSGLQAQQRYYNKFEKKWEVLEDSKTRLQAAQIGLQYLEGLPVQRVHSVNVDATPRASLADMNSPAMLEAMERHVARMRKKAAAHSLPASSP